MSKSKLTFDEEFYKDFQKWLKKNKIMQMEVDAIKGRVNKYISEKLRPIDRQILFDHNLLTVGGYLTEDGLHMLVRLETWDFNQKK